jgi:hypothetical protein
MARHTKDEVEEAAMDRPTKQDLDATNQPYVQLSFQLPSFYLRVLDREAELLSQRRSTLLEFLVLRKMGVVHFERSSAAPRYRPERAELRELKRYVWHCRPDIKDRLDRLRERMGNIPPRSWVILALNEWIGLPAGVGDLDDEGPTRPTTPPGRRRSAQPPPIPKDAK